MMMMRSQIVLHFRQNVGGKDNGVVARQTLDQVARLDDLVRVESGGGLVQNQDVGIMDDRLRQSYALPVPFGQLPDFLVADVGDRALFHHFIDALGQAGLSAGL